MDTAAEQTAYPFTNDAATVAAVCDRRFYLGARGLQALCLRNKTVGHRSREGIKNPFNSTLNCAESPISREESVGSRRLRCPALKRAIAVGLSWPFARSRQLCGNLKRRRPDQPQPLLDVVSQTGPDGLGADFFRTSQLEPSEPQFLL